MESKYGSPSSQHSRVEAEHVIVGELQPIIFLDDVQFVQKRGSNADSSDASSFSSDSSSDEFIQVDHTATLLAMSTTKEEEEDDGNAVSKKSLVLEEYTRSSSSSSRVSDVTIESFIPDVSPAQSPPVIQVMQGKEDFDPHRLPPSIFEKPSSPMDWSVASNESLFSIHIGNGSFNENQIGVLGDSVEFKSGELKTSDKFYESKDPKLPGELLKSRENASEVKDIQVPQDFVSSKGIVLEQALGNTPKKIVNKKDNHKAGTSIPSYTHPRKQSRCCGSMSAYSCKWLTCPTCSCYDSCCKWLTCPTCSCCDSCYRSCCSWPNSCCRTDVCCCHPTTWPCCNCKCSTWWNLCNCFSTCSNCCSRGFCSTSSWTCSIRNMLCCFSFQRLKNPESPKASQRCRCCFSCFRCSCCCS